jgi:hypothetical protein
VLRRYGQFRHFLPRRDVPPSRNPPIPSRFTLFLEGLVLQPGLQYHHHHHLPDLQRTPCAWQGRNRLRQGLLRLDCVFSNHVLNESELLQSVTIDGQPWHSNCYLDWDVFVKGSTIELELTSDINNTCGEGADALPPSLSTGGYSGMI